MSGNDFLPTSCQEDEESKDKHLKVGHHCLYDPQLKRKQRNIYGRYKILKNGWVSVSLTFTTQID